MHTHTHAQQHIWKPHLLLLQTANTHTLTYIQIHTGVDIRVRVWQGFAFYKENGVDTEMKQRWMENDGLRNEATRDRRSLLCVCYGERERERDIRGQQGTDRQMYT